MMSLGGRKCHFDIAFDNTSSPRVALLCDYGDDDRVRRDRRAVQFLRLLPLLPRQHRCVLLARRMALGRPRISQVRNIGLNQRL